MIDLIDLTCPTNKDKYNTGDKILVTDGNNVYLVPCDTVGGDNTNELQLGIVTYNNRNNEPNTIVLEKIDLLDFIAELEGVKSTLTGRRTKFSEMGIDQESILELCVERGYIAAPDFRLVELTIVTTTARVSFTGDFPDNDKKNIRFFYEADSKLYELLKSSEAPAGDPYYSSLEIGSTRFSFDFYGLSGDTKLYVKYYDGINTQTVSAKVV